jgi:hypothetical protein
MTLHLIPSKDPSFINSEQYIDLIGLVLQIPHPQHCEAAMVLLVGVFFSSYFFLQYLPEEFWIFIFVYSCISLAITINRLKLLTNKL